MKKIKYNDISNDTDNLLKVIGKMIPIYKKMQYHTQVLECEQWIIMLNRISIQTEYTSEAILALKNILNDCANINLSFGNFKIGILSMDLLFKVCELFNKDN